MSRALILCGPVLAACALAGPAASADLAVELWTDRGNGAVYEHAEPIELSARTSDDAHLLVYEIDTQGYVRMIYPTAGHAGFVQGRATLALPEHDADYELAVQGPEGIGYIVAVASRRPFRDLPWYLRPYDFDADPEDMIGAPDEEQGITREGQVVGDPFVAMERIRRAVMDPELSEADIASAYTSYHVGHRFRYPRYLCNDCHRPDYWAWWPTFDPYYATCSVFSFRVNYHWWWGWPCWTGYVPYYVYVVRSDCPPYYSGWANVRYSSWDGWARWNSLWGDRVARYKPATPVSYVPPVKRKDGGYVLPPGERRPPAFRDPSGRTPNTIGGVPVGRMRGPTGEGGGDPAQGVRRKQGAERMPVRLPEGSGQVGRTREWTWREPGSGSRGGTRPSLRPPRSRPTTRGRGRAPSSSATLRRESRRRPLAWSVRRRRPAGPCPSPRVHRAAAAAAAAERTTAEADA
jgi:hypothetical protein